MDWMASVNVHSFSIDVSDGWAVSSNEIDHFLQQTFMA